MKTYFKTETLGLLGFKTEEGVLILRNSRLEYTQSQILELNPIQIKKEKFSQLLNKHYANIHEEWIFNHSPYRSLDNFISENRQISSNYKIGTEVPLHQIRNKINALLVYHNGGVFYHDISYGGNRQGKLYNTKTENFVGYTALKNCAPIFNINTKKIV